MSSAVHEFPEVPLEGVVATMRQKLKTLAPQLERELSALNERQTVAIYHCSQGRSVFLSGVAGSGKSTVTRTLVRFLTALDRKVALTATTGLAAANLEAVDVGVVPKTLHSFAAVGLGEDSVGDLIKAITRPKNVYMMAARTRWRTTQVLIVDEVSMLSPVFFTKLDKVARAVRGRPAEPFGGLVLFLVGDFHQLEPVLKGSEKVQAKAMNASYCFQSEAWRDAIDAEIMLNHVYRQQDCQFVDILREVREGCASKSTVQRLRDRTAMMLRIDLDSLAHRHFGGAGCAKIVDAARERYELWSNGKDPTVEDNRNVSTAPSTTIKIETTDEEERPQKRARVIESEDDEDSTKDKTEQAPEATEDDDDKENDEEEPMPDIDWYTFDQYARCVSRSTAFDDTEALIRTLPADLIDSAHAVYVSEIMPTRLMAVNRKVEDENRRRLLGINEPVSTFESRLDINVTKSHSVYNKAYKDFDTYFQKNILAPARLSLKRGAQVMLLCNINPPALVNGRRGIVIAFRTLEEQDLIDGVVRPVKVETTASGNKRKRAEKPGKGRKGGLSELSKAQLDAIDKMSLPVVRFDNGVEARIEPYVWQRKKRFEKKQVKAQYIQVPLVGGAAISIHKCVAGDTLIQTETRGLVPIEELVKDYKDTRVLTHTGKYQLVVSHYSGSTEPSIIITTSLGYRIECSHRHPLLVRNANGTDQWIKAPNIKVTDTIALEEGAFDTVTVITESECQMFDIEVEEDHSFIGNGIVNHNSQGMTITSLDVDLSEVFASGQTYVALSRATDLNGLVIRNFDPAYIDGSKSPPNKAVIDYYIAMEKNQQTFYQL